MTDGATASSADPSRSDAGQHPGSPDGTPVYSADSDELVTAIERARHPQTLEEIPAEQCDNAFTDGRG